MHLDLQISHDCHSDLEIIELFHYDIFILNGCDIGIITANVLSRKVLSYFSVIFVLE